jgi:hypothetical protein
MFGHEIKNLRMMHMEGRASVEPNAPRQIIPYAYRINLKRVRGKSEIEGERAQQAG